MNYGSEYIGKYVKVIDCRNNNIISSGKVIGSKNDFPNGGISFDNKWFFRETEKLKFEVVDFIETKLLIVEPDKLGLTWDFLKEKDIEKLDVRRDFGYDELDKEIKDYIYGFNEITNTIKTTTSCSGHGIKPWYIEFEFSNFNDMSKFINIVETFEKQLRLFSVQSAGKEIKIKKIHLILQPTIDDWDFKILDRFYKKIKILFN